MGIGVPHDHENIHIYRHTGIHKLLISLKLLMNTWATKLYLNSIETNINIKLVFYKETAWH